MKINIFYESMSISSYHSSSEGDFRIEGRKAQVVVIENLWKDRTGAAVRSQRSSQAQHVHVYIYPLPLPLPPLSFPPSLSPVLPWAAIVVEWLLVLPSRGDLPPCNKKVLQKGSLTHHNYFKEPPRYSPGHGISINFNVLFFV